MQSGGYSAIAAAAADDIQYHDMDCARLSGTVTEVSMKRYLSLILAAVMLLCVPACFPAAAEEAALRQRTLRPGADGEDVARLQRDLQYLGYYAGEITGVYDDAAAAVKAFQKARGLDRDGITGKKTHAALEQALEESRSAGLPEDTARMINTVIAGSGAVCGSLVITKDGRTVVCRSFGGADENTCFRSASVTKWVTAIGLMTLYDQGRLDLDRDVSDYLPFRVRNPAWPDTEITARMLLSHTSSLSPKAEKYHPDWERIGKGGYDPLFDESVQPGTAYAYADYNGALFGGLTEAISGESVQNYLSRTVFEPLGLTAAYNPRYLPAGTSVRDMLRPTGAVAISARKDRQNPYNNRPDPRANNGYTVGRLYICTASLSRLAQMMLSDGTLDGAAVLRPETVALMEADQPGLAPSRYGLGTVRVNGFPGGTWYGHQGRYSGFSANVYYQRETGITMSLILDGYDYQLQDNIVLPAAQILQAMPELTGTARPED